MPRIQAAFFNTALLLVFVCGLEAQLSDQDYLPDRVDVLEPPAMFAANAAIAGVAGGLGHLIQGKSVWSGLLQGAGGGTLVGVGKYLSGQTRALGWPGKITAALGTSVLHNSTRARRPFSAVGLDIGPVFLRVTRQEGGAVQVEPFLLPGSALMTIKAFAEGDRLELEESLLTGTPIFSSDEVEGGKATFNVIRVRSDYEQFIVNVNGDWVIVDRDRVLLHERIHVLQFSTSRAVSLLVNPTRYVADRAPLEDLGLHTETLVSYLVLAALDDAFWDEPTPLEAESLSLFQ